MFGLVRRISYGLIPRADRPWEEDPTSNAPQRRKKRRLSSTERPDVDADEEVANKKRARGESGTPDADEDATFLTPPLPAGPDADTQEVKDVTQGVKEVDLDGKDETPAPAEGDKLEAAPAPESVPLPDEKSGELDEPSSDTSTPPPAQPATITKGDVPSPSSAEAPSQTAPAEEAEDTPTSPDQDIAQAEKGLKDVAIPTISKSVESSITPAAITVSQN